MTTVANWKTLLVTTDLSERSRGALDLALTLKHQMDLVVDVLHVVELDAVRRSNADFAPDAAAYQHTLKAFESRTKAKGRSDLDHFLATYGDGAFRPVVEIGERVYCIVAHAKSIKADAIVMATHGRSGLSHALLGSVAEEVMRHAPCPVLMIVRKEG